MEFSQNLKDNITYLHKKLNVETNFDVVYRVVHIGGREACLYFIDGFTKDESLLKILQVFSTIKPEDMPKDAHASPNSMFLTARLDCFPMTRI